MGFTPAIKPQIIPGASGTGQIPPTSDITTSPMTNCMPGGYDTSQHPMVPPTPTMGPQISSCGGGDQRPVSMRDCSASEPPTDTQKGIAPSAWPPADAIPQPPVCNPETDTMQQRSNCGGVHHPTATMPGGPMNPPPGGDTASEAYAYYLRSLQSLGQHQPRYVLIISCIG